MTAQILYFNQKTEPKEPVIGYRMSFYREEEIDIVLVALNMYSTSDLRYTRYNLKGIEPIFIKECLIRLKLSSICSNETKKIINIIIDNIKEITAIAK
jgi:hypothetical protein